MSDPAVRVDTTSQVPPYEQVRAQLAALIRTRRGAGTRVAALPSGPHAHDADQLVTLARDFSSAARALGADTEDILTAVRDALDPEPTFSSATADNEAAGPKTVKESARRTDHRGPDVRPGVHRPRLQ